MMEVFAGYTAQTDYEMGRLLAEIRSRPDADNTLIIYMVGDNGSSAEGGLVGLLEENSFFNNVPETLSVNLKHINELGGPKHFNHFPAGWAWAMDTPFQWTKQIASHFGGTRNPMVIVWPDKIKDAGGIRDQFSHVIDIAPTVYQAAGVTAPTELNGVSQKPIEGLSIVYTFDSSAAKGRRRTQYFEMLGNRAIYSDGWVAASRAATPWVSVRADPNIDTLKWELYHIDEDFAEAKDLAAQMPEKVRQLEELWWAEAARYQVLPIDVRATERLNGELMGRPSATAGRTRFVYYAGTEALPSRSAPNLLNKSWSITADVDIPGGKVPPSGTVFAFGGNDGGYAIYLRNGKPEVASNFLGRAVYSVTSKTALPPGGAVIRVDFKYDGGGYGKGGVLSLFANDKPLGEVRLVQTLPFGFGLGGILDVGADNGTTVDNSLAPPFWLQNATVSQVVIEYK